MQADGDDGGLADPFQGTPSNVVESHPSSTTTTLSAAESAVNRAVGDMSGNSAEKQWRQTWMIMEYADKGSLQVARGREATCLSLWGGKGHVLVELCPIHPSTNGQRVSHHKRARDLKGSNPCCRMLGLPRTPRHTHRVPHASPPLPPPSRRSRCRT